VTWPGWRRQGERSSLASQGRHANEGITDAGRHAPSDNLNALISFPNARDNWMGCACAANTVRLSGIVSSLRKQKLH
jgi:hypothetical protein